VTEKPFIDYYEVLQLSQTASDETVERVYRLLAKRYHPDNQTTGNADTFSEVHEAYQVLSDAKRRAQFDVQYDENRSIQWKIFDQNSANDGRETDRRVFHALLSLLYVARRRDPIHGGLGAVYIEKMLGVPQQHLEFPIWYMRQKRWVETTDTGQLAITAEGIDSLTGKKLDLPADRLLAESSLAKAEQAEEATVQSVLEAAGIVREADAPVAATGGTPSSSQAPGAESEAAKPGVVEDKKEPAEFDEVKERLRSYEQTLRGSSRA
jgi:DnaJ-domain-containing protein 1